MTIKEKLKEDGRTLTWLSDNLNQRRSSATISKIVNLPLDNYPKKYEWVLIQLKDLGYEFKYNLI